MFNNGVLGYKFSIDYSAWKMQMEALLRKNDLWEYVSGEIPRPPAIPGNEAAIKLWIKQDKKARSEIILSMNANSLNIIDDSDTSMQVWEKIASIASRNLGQVTHNNP